MLTSSLFLATLPTFCSLNLYKVEEVLNGVETMKMEDGEEDEVKQPRVTKAQKRRVRSEFQLK